MLRLVRCACSNSSEAWETHLPRPAALWSLSRRPSRVASVPVHTAVRSPRPTHLLFDRDIFSPKLLQRSSFRAVVSVLWQHHRVTSRLFMRTHAGITHLPVKPNYCHGNGLGLSRAEDDLRPCEDGRLKQAEITQNSHCSVSAHGQSPQRVDEGIWTDNYDRHIYLCCFIFFIYCKYLFKVSEDTKKEGIGQNI